MNEMIAPKELVESLIDNALAFGVGLISSVNRELKDEGYKEISEAIILEIAYQKLQNNWRTK